MILRSRESRDRSMGDLGRGRGGRSAFCKRPFLPFSRRPAWHCWWHRSIDRGTAIVFAWISTRGRSRLFSHQKRSDLPRQCALSGEGPSEVCFGGSRRSEAAHFLLFSLWVGGWMCTLSCWSRGGGICFPLEVWCLEIRSPECVRRLACCQQQQFVEVRQFLVNFRCCFGADGWRVTEVLPKGLIPKLGGFLDWRASQELPHLWGETCCALHGQMPAGVEGRSSASPPAYGGTARFASRVAAGPISPKSTTDRKTKQCVHDMFVLI